MWPISMKKPLKMPWLAERARQRASNGFATPCAKRKRYEAIEIAICTPYRRLEVRAAIEIVINKEALGSTARLLFRNCGTATDQKNLIEHFRPKKRKKGKPGPNERFANIKSIRDTREQIKKLGKEYIDDIKEERTIFQDTLCGFQLELDYRE
ncbi:uncharacterized protein FOBCDRAFT_204293 [Fusarium oxysporum Fo47]|uniref:uncharacterized protein n=1 Tax=Fusarium oxysporum Fo47 TaxID=660027 RepID=UPI00286999C5|nr:uncharacterized protein FOBCDRAFT_204293 [Fusarium oxysporum Fo47]WJG35792.1 hypothetical protein FOBCDRAFT_204293 [Fusarium oxysporum Fo47]